MSQYVEFFIRVGDTFAPINSFSRSNELYSAFQYKVPYEKIRAVNYDMLHAAAEDLEGNKRHYEEQIKDLEKEQAAVATFNNTAEDKIELIVDIQSEINEMKDYVDACNYSVNFVSFLEDILDGVRFDDEHNYDVNNYVYAGIEAGWPTVEDIEE